MYSLDLEYMYLKRIPRSHPPSPSIASLYNGLEWGSEFKEGVFGIDSLEEKCYSNKLSIIDIPLHSVSIFTQVKVAILW